MRVLLDECLPRSLKRHLHGHDVTTVPEAGWAGTKNGELLRRAAERFDAFVTIDWNLAARRTPLPVAVVTLVARTNRIADLLPLVPGILSALDSLPAGGVVVVGE